MLWNAAKWQLIINSTNSPALQKRWIPSLHPDYERCLIAAPIYRYYKPSSLKFGTVLGGLIAEVSYYTNSLEPFSHFLLPETQNSVHL